VLEAQNQIDFVVVGRIMDEQSLGVREQSEAMPERDFPLSVRLNAKWGPPRLARAFDRQRLLDELDRLTARQCTWLVAPGGYGKTYLLQSYIKARQRPALWYNLDEGDSDVVGFFSDFCEALERVGLGPLLRLSPEVQSLSRFGRLFFHQFGERCREPTLLVLDDYHHVAADSGLHEAIAAALDYLPVALHLILLSREAPPPAFARAQSHLQMGILGADELALTEDEAIGIAHLVTNRRAPDQAIEEVRRRAGGWAAGFVVLLGQTDSSQVPSESVTTLFNYFENEVIKAAPGDTRSFLWQTALLPSLTAEMAERLTGRKDAADLLAELAGGNYFLYIGQSSAPVYRYHDLFRDYLLDYGQRQHADQWPEMVQGAADILSDVGEPDRAANLYAEIRDWTGLGRLVSRHAPMLLQRGSYRALQRWLSLLPGELRDSQPWLVYWDGCSRLAVDPKQARERLTRACTLFSEAGERLGSLLAWAGVCQAHWFAFDDMRPLAAWLDELDALWPGPEFELPEEIEAQVALGAFLCMLMTRPDDPAFGYWEDRLTRLMDGNENPEQKSMAATLLLIHLTWKEGDVARATMLLDALHAAQQSPSVAPMTLIAATTWGESIYDYLFGEGSAAHCMELLQATIDLGEQRGVHVFDATLYGAIALLRFSTSHIKEARLAIDKMRDSLNWERTFDVGLYLLLSAWDALVSGRLLEALEIGRQELRYIERLDQMHTLVVSHLEVAQITNRIGLGSEALGHLAKIGHWSRRTRSRIGPCIRGLALAQFALQKGRRRRARELLRITLALAESQGFLGSLYFLPEDLTALYAEALSCGIQPEYCRRVIRCRALPAPRTMKSTERWPWPVKVYAFGALQLQLDGAPYLATRKPQQKPMELLKALVALGGESVSQEQLGDLLWPDADGDVAAGNFKTTLSRLRKLLGKQDLLVVRENRCEPSSNLLSLPNRHRPHPGISGTCRAGCCVPAASKTRGLVPGMGRDRHRESRWSGSRDVRV